MAIQMNITTEGLAKFRAALETGKLETLKTAKFYGGWSGGAVSGSVVATLDIAVNKEIESNSNVCRFVCQDKSDAQYTTYGGEVIDADGVVIATFNNGGEPVTTKQSKAEMMLGFEIKLEDNTAASSVINMGDTTFVFDDATETAAGIIELATEAEAKAGTDTKRAITPKTLKAKLQEYLPLAGGTINGAVSYNTSAVTSRTSNDSFIVLCGGKGFREGGRIVAYGKDNEQEGRVYLEAHDGTNCTVLSVYADGRVIANNKNVVRSVNGTNADAAGNVVIPLNFLPLAGGTITGLIITSNHIKTTSNEFSISSDANTKTVRISGGTGWGTGASLVVRGGSNPLGPGNFVVKAADGSQECSLIGSPDGTLTWGGKKVMRENDFQVVSVLPENPDADTFYFVVDEGA